MIFRWDRSGVHSRRIYLVDQFRARPGLRPPRCEQVRESWTRNGQQHLPLRERIRPKERCSSRVWRKEISRIKAGPCSR